MNKDILKSLAVSIVDKIEENMGVGGIAGVGPAQAGNGFAGTLSNIGSVGTGQPMPNGVGNAKASDSKGTTNTSNAAGKDSKLTATKLPDKAKTQVLALVNSVNGPLGRKSASVGNVPTVSTSVKTSEPTVKATISQIGR